MYSLSGWVGAFSFFLSLTHSLTHSTVTVCFNGHSSVGKERKGKERKEKSHHRHQQQSMDRDEFERERAREKERERERERDLVLGTE